MPTDLRITNARAAELAALAAGAEHVSLVAREAITDLLADRATLLAALRRAVAYVEDGGWPQTREDSRAALLRDLDAFRAEPEGRDA